MFFSITELRSSPSSGTMIFVSGLTILLMIASA